MNGVRLSSTASDSCFIPFSLSAAPNPTARRLNKSSPSACELPRILTRLADPPTADRFLLDGWANEWTNRSKTAHNRN